MIISLESPGKNKSIEVDGELEVTWKQIRFSYSSNTVCKIKFKTKKELEKFAGEVKK